MESTDTIRAADFLRAIFGEWERGYLVLFRIEETGRTNVVFVDRERVDAAAEEAIEQSTKIRNSGLYYGLGLQEQELSSGERGGSETVIAIPGVWVDLDIAEGKGAKKSKKKYPPREHAEQVLKQMPLAPSLVMDSGGGLQCYWLFRELFSIVDDADRTRAAAMVKGWENLTLEKLRRVGEGYEMDAIGDLARVLRVGGSWNFRHGRPVRVVEGYDLNNLLRYDPADLEPFIVDSSPAVNSPGRVYNVGQLDISKDRNPPVDKKDALEINLPEFRRAWMHTKKFPSCSEAELSLAAYAVQAAWTDQEIADLIIAHRRKYEPEKIAKALRPDYLKATIAKARGDTTRDGALRAMNGDAQAAADVARLTPAGSIDMAAVEAGPIVEDDRAAILKQLSVVLGVDVAGWVQLGREKPIYSLVLASGQKIRIGTVRDVIRDCHAMRQAIYSGADVVMPIVKQKQWDGVCQSLLRIVEIQDATDATDTSRVRHGIRAYLNAVDVFDDKARDMACQGCFPFREDGDIHLHLEHLRRWLGGHTADKWTAGDLLHSLRAIGMVNRIVFCESKDGKRTTRSYWKATLENVIG